MSLAAAFATEILNEVSQGELTFAVARRIETLAKAAQKVLLPANAKQAKALMCTTSDLAQMGDGGEDDSMGIGAMGGGYNSETFGARMLREALELFPAMMRQQRRSPTELTLALATARREGMTDVAKALEAELLGAASGEPAAPVHPYSALLPVIPPDAAT